MSEGPPIEDCRRRVLEKGEQPGCIPAALIESTLLLGSEQGRRQVGGSWQILGPQRLKDMTPCPVAQPFLVPPSESSEALQVLQRVGIPSAMMVQPQPADHVFPYLA